MSEQGYESGSASGWAVLASNGKGWRWSAFGPGGSASGTAASAGRARELAMRELERLTRPRP